MDKTGHGELSARRRSMAMAATAMRDAALPLLEWWCYRVGKVGEVVAELHARTIEQWCDGDSE